MIKSGEINKIANQNALRDTQIEKDYILGWILYGISKNDTLDKLLVFKGGTAIRKLYINNYRLSEDLDFTISEGKINMEQLKTEFKNVIDWVKNESRMELEIRDENLNTKGNYSFYIGYVGPLGGDITKRDIKVDISDSEILCDEIVNRTALNEYSDLSEEYSLKSYSINEIIAEKLRSLMQRTVPRDLYDIWYLLEIEQNDLESCIEFFKKKAEYKDKDPAKFYETISAKEEKFKAEWKKSLEKQFKEIPDFEKIWRESLRHFKKISKQLN
ncbi:MAG: nucleotidyl transferase AbiEii/AbiGii toxin family protein [Bacteroidetes bacterium]|nr:nucleotidyl transferase AbiEii/AbiGii toxin family protein [Bacteroidota bacterium]